MRPRPRTLGAGALLAGMTAMAALVGLAAAGGAAFGGAAAGRSPAQAPVAPKPATTRLFGADRYATAAAVSAGTFPAGAPVAYLATGSDYPDALAAAAAAGGRGPVLLGGASDLP